MKGALHGWVRRWWRGETGAAGTLLDVLTLPLELVWRGGVAVAGWAHRAIPVEGLRVVSVGNLAVGGTGKTPLAAWACRLLVEAGERPALVTRGYGRDELLLHRRWNPAVAVVADPDRVAAAREARAGGATVAVVDDGFQHRRLARDVDVVLLAAEDPFPGKLLPRGPYREPPGALERADVVVVTRRTSASQVARALADEVRRRHPGLPVARAALTPGGWAALDGGPAPAPEGDVLVATGVARPEAVRAHAAEQGGAGAELLAFPDHHEFTAEDARRIRARAGDRTVVVTEKDAVKLEPLAELLGPCRVLVQDLRWEEGGDLVRSLLLDTPEQDR